MDFKNPSYITKNRLGIYYFQLRVPKQFCQNNPHLPPLIRKSLGTRNRREALRLARKMVVLMENTDYRQTLSAIDENADKHNELFHRGKFLFETLERLEKGRESLFLRKLVLGIPAQASGKNLKRPPMPSAARIRPRFATMHNSPPVRCASRLPK